LLRVAGQVDMRISLLELEEAVELVVLEPMEHMTTLLQHKHILSRWGQVERLLQEEELRTMVVTQLLTP